MTDDFDNELLSALLDGELTPDQQASISERVANSESLTAELGQLSQLSSLMGGLPQESAPPQLAQGVMSELLQSPTPTPATSSSASRGFNWKRWSGAAAMLTAAAALLLVLPLSSPEPAMETARTVSDSAVANSKMAEFSSALESQGAMAPARESSRPELDLDASPVLEQLDIVEPVPQALSVVGPAELMDQMTVNGLNVIRIDSEKRDVATLLTGLLTSQKLLHRQETEHEMLSSEGLEAIVVDVDVNSADLSSMLDQVAKLTGRGSLSVVERNTAPESWHKQLLVAMELSNVDAGLAGAGLAGVNRLDVDNTVVAGDAPLARQRGGMGAAVAAPDAASQIIIPSTSSMLRSNGQSPKPSLPTPSGLARKQASPRGRAAVSNAAPNKVASDADRTKAVAPLDPQKSQLKSQLPAASPVTENRAIVADAATAPASALAANKKDLKQTDAQAKYRVIFVVKAAANDAGDKDPCDDSGPA